MWWGMGEFGDRERDRKRKIPHNKKYVVFSKFGNIIAEKYCFDKTFLSKILVSCNVSSFCLGTLSEIGNLLKERQRILVKIKKSIYFFSNILCNLIFL